MVTARSKSAPWDIFCKVVDNFGDAGVCWRLARILQYEHGVPVRIWIDDLEPLQALCPAVDAGIRTQRIDYIEIHHWDDSLPVADDGAVVIEAFGCGLGDELVMRMAARAQPPLWIVLEYLSAESWVDEHHGLASPHPRLPLQRYFFFPGFTAVTGGLLREADLLTRRDAYGARQRQAFWHGLGYADATAPALTLSLFAYASAPVIEWLTVLAQGTQPVVVAVPGTVLLPAVQAVCGAVLPEGSSSQQGTTLRRGALEVRLLPFLPQLQYDELLWACDLNLVRGEDSLVRALWAARPLVWQPYRQEDGAHRPKLAAFMDCYGAGLPPATLAAMTAFWRVWNGEGGDITAVWDGLRGAVPALQEHARHWSTHLAEFDDLAAQLVDFVRDKVE